jgi:hypothetical protein
MPKVNACVASSGVFSDETVIRTATSKTIEALGFLGIVIVCEIASIPAS